MTDVQQALDNDRNSFEKLQEPVKAANKVTLEKGIKCAYEVGKNNSGGLSLVSDIATQLTVSEKAAATLLKLGKTARLIGLTVAFLLCLLKLYSLLKML
jgi:hypothetical protein